jgi:hypothetical protein
MAKRSGGLKKHCVCPYCGEKFEVVAESDMRGKKNTLVTAILAIPQKIYESSNIKL